MKLVSACLLGVNCKYDGRSRPHPKVVELAKAGGVVPVCPEQLGGLPTPRERCELRGRKVFSESGKDLTKAYRKGAADGLKVARLLGCHEAILKARSPSCGVGVIWALNGELVSRDGLFAALLRKSSIRVMTEEDL